MIPKSQRQRQKLCASVPWLAGMATRRLSHIGVFPAVPPHQVADGSRGEMMWRGAHGVHRPRRLGHATSDTGGGLLRDACTACFHTFLERGTSRGKGYVRYVPAFPASKKTVQHTEGTLPTFRQVGVPGSDRGWLHKKTPCKLLVLVLFLWRLATILRRGAAFDVPGWYQPSL